MSPKTPIKAVRREIGASLDPDLFKISSANFCLKIILWLLILLLGCFLVSKDAGLVIMCGILVLGLAFVHGVELQHQALHNTGFHSKKLNEITGILLGLPMLVSFYEYQFTHLKHHANVGTGNDTEFFEIEAGGSTTVNIVKWIFMIDHFSKYLRNLFNIFNREHLHGFPQRMHRRVSLFYFITLIFLTSLVFSGFAMGNDFRYFYCWGAALLFVAAPIHAMIELPEHFACDNEAKAMTKNTRSMRSTKLMQWFTNYNNFHVEHHMYPTVPMQLTPSLFDKIWPEHQHYLDGYFSFYSDLLRRSLFRQKSRSSTKS